jgi:hypothetical protein
VTAPEPMGLVERLREQAAALEAITVGVSYEGYVAASLMNAAAEIERLKAECNRLANLLVENGEKWKVDQARAANAEAALQSHSSGASSVSREAVQSTAAAAHADNTSGGKRCE